MVYPKTYNSFYSIVDSNILKSNILTYGNCIDVVVLDADPIKEEHGWLFS